MPLFLDVEVKSDDVLNGHYRLCEDPYNGAPLWRLQGGGGSLFYNSSQGRWHLLVNDAQYSHLCSSPCSASTPPQDVEGWTDSDTRQPVDSDTEPDQPDEPVAVSISVHSPSVPSFSVPKRMQYVLGALEESPGNQIGRLTVLLVKARIDAERQREAARGSAEQLKAERATTAELKKQLAAVKRDAAQLKEEGDELRAQVGQTAEKLEAAREERAAAAEDAAARGVECTELKSQVAELKKEVHNGVSRQRDLEHQLDELRERLAAAEAPPCPAERRYFVPYAGEVAARSPGQVDAVNRSFLLQCADIPGAGSEQDFLDMYEYLKEKVDNRMKELGHDFRGMSKAAVRMTLFWSTDSTRCAPYNGLPKEFCGWINLALSYKECDRPIRRALAVIRTLNDFCVTVPKCIGDSPPAPGGRIAGAVMEETWRKIEDNEWKLYRGGGFPPELKDWFYDGRTYRQPRYLAASLKQGVARNFARQEGEREGRIQVLWVIEIDKDKKCCHLNYLGVEYSFFDEEELLFAPYSVFTVQSVDWAAPGSAEPSRICLKAVPDNKSEEFPLNLPEAPWS